MWRQEGLEVWRSDDEAFVRKQGRAIKKEGRSVDLSSTFHHRGMQTARSSINRPGQVGSISLEMKP